MKSEKKEGTSNLNLGKSSEVSELFFFFTFKKKEYIFWLFLRVVLRINHNTYVPLKIDNKNRCKVLFLMMLCKICWWPAYQDIS